MKTYGSERGASVTEFVVIAPLLALCVFATLEIHDRIEIRQATLIASRNAPGALALQRHSISKRESIGGAPGVEPTRAPSPLPEPAARESVLRDLYGQGHFVSTRKAAERDALFKNQGDYRLNLRSELLDRKDSGWSRRREGALSVVGTDSPIANGLTRVASEASRALSGTLDLVKGDAPHAISDFSFLTGKSIPLFIDDRASTLETAVELRFPRSSGAWDSSLALLEAMATKEKEVTASGSRIDVATRVYSETEAGYHPYSYRAGSILGLVWGLVDVDLKHWSQEREVRPPWRMAVMGTMRVPERSFSHACMYFYLATSGCVLPTGYTNTYTTIVHTVANVMTIVDVVATVFTAGGYQGAKQGLGMAMDKAIDAAVDTVKKRVKEQAEQKLEEKKRELEDRLKHRIKQTAEKALSNAATKAMGGLTTECLAMRGISRAKSDDATDC